MFGSLKRDTRASVGLEISKSNLFIFKINWTLVVRVVIIVSFSWIVIIAQSEYSAADRGTYGHLLFVERPR